MCLFYSFISLPPYALASSCSYLSSRLYDLDSFSFGIHMKYAKYGRGVFQNSLSDCYALRIS